MSRITVIALSCAALVGGLALATGTSAQAPGPPSGTLELVQSNRDLKTGFVDNPPRRKESVGDVFVIGGVVRHPDGRTAGRAAGVFTQTEKRYAQGTAVFKLANGHIVASGMLDELSANDSTDTLAIVGGTGAYAGARGTLVITNGENESRFLVTFGG